MKKTFLIGCLTLVSIVFAFAQDHPYRVAFDLTSNDKELQSTITRWIREISQGNPDAEIEVVMYGKGLELVMPERSTVSEEVKQALKNPKISFAVCQMAMERQNIAKSMLFDGVQSVPDGIYELIKKQQEGWGYIKVVR